MNRVKIEIGDVPARLQEIITLATAGTEVIVMDGKVARFKVVPLPTSPGRRLGLHPGAIEVADDFDDPLPDEFWLGES
jgi:antitoxin (DNA-binding transcriptional repressor) of toxin-antitoxin stability system